MSNFNFFLWLYYYLFNIPRYIVRLLCEHYHIEICFVYQLEMFVRLFLKESFQRVGVNCVQCSDLAPPSVVKNLPKI